MIVVCHENAAMNLQPKTRLQPAEEGQDPEIVRWVIEYVSFLIASGRDVIERVGSAYLNGLGQDWITHEEWLMSRRNDK